MNPIVFDSQVNNFHREVQPIKASQSYSALYVEGQYLNIQMLEDTGLNLYTFLQNELKLYSFTWINYPSLGHFLDCIGSVCSDQVQRLSWMIYVDGKLSSEGADLIMMNNRLQVSIKYEKYQNSPE